jgi:hypothetical protein
MINRYLQFPSEYASAYSLAEGVRMPDSPRKRFKRRDEVQVMEFEVFDLDLDDSEKEQLRRDPAGFLKRVIIEDELPAMNALYVDDKFLGPDGTSGTLGVTPPVPQVYHCIRPPASASKYITIVHASGDPDKVVE